MRLTLICATLLLASLPIVDAVGEGQVPGRSAMFFASQGKAAGFILQVPVRGPVSLGVTVNAGQYTGLHIRGAHCTDPGATSGRAPSAGTSSSCGILSEGSYFVTVSVDKGFLQGQLSATGGRVT